MQIEIRSSGNVANPSIEQFFEQFVREQSLNLVFAIGKPFAEIFTEETIVVGVFGWFDL